MLAGFSFLLWKQLSSAHFSTHLVEETDLLSLVFSLFLMPLNWWFEWRKWELINNSNECSNERKWHGFLAGFVTSMLTPGLVGNFIGRIYFFDKEKRSEIVFLTLLGNLAQFLMSLFFGVVALWVLKKTPLDLPFNSVFIPAVIVLFFGIALFFFAVKPWQVLVGFFPSLRINGSFSGFIYPFLILSFTRHILFTIQFALVLSAFGAEVTLSLIYWIWQVYLVVTLVPSVFFGKVIIRDTVAVFVLSQAAIGLDNIGIFTSSFTVWVINLFIPLLIALFLLRRKSYVD